MLKNNLIMDESGHMEKHLNDEIEYYASFKLICKVCIVLKEDDK
jgi:hypothetical protein